MNKILDIAVAFSVGGATYYLLYKVLFENRAEWLCYLKRELKWLPIGVLLDYDPYSSVRFWFWAISGLFLGGATYFVLSHY